MQNFRLKFTYFCTFLSGPEMISRFESAKDEKSAIISATMSSADSDLLCMSTMFMKDIVKSNFKVKLLMTG